MISLIRIGTRSSRLALVQTNFVIERLKELGFRTEIYKYTTSGDKFVNSNLYDIGGKGLFLKEIEIALRNNEIDIAVHSLKDCPGILDKDFEIAGLLKRGEPRDVLLSYNAKSILDLPINAKVGTCSPRRRVQLLKLRPDLNIVNIRGSVETRLQKFLNKEYDAIILAAIGLQRLGLFDNKFCSYISINEMIPAVGQAVIAIEITKNNQLMKNIIREINDVETEKLIRIEREYLASLNGNCNSPIAAYVRKDNNKIIGDFLHADYDMKFYKKESKEITR